VKNLTQLNNMWTISKEFNFDAAHSLPHLPSTHKCHHLHGHTYKVVIHCSGGLIPDKHWVIDYGDIKKSVQPIIDLLDHKNLNELLPIVTTAENISQWLYEQLEGKIPLSRVDVHETTGTCCSYQK